MLTLRHAFLVAALVLAAAGQLWAQPVLVTTPVSVGPTDITILGTPLATAQITVQGTTLTMNGRHAIASLSLIRNPANQPGVLTHAAGASFDYSGGQATDIVEGLELRITGDLVIEGPVVDFVASRIDLAGRGFGPAAGPGGSLSAPFNDAGGASHGGNGGVGTQGGPGATYGSIQQPNRLGSGGGSFGGLGGGRIRLAVTGNAQVNGVISADGAPGFGGGGSGGSIFLACAQLSGAGRISADGGGSGSGNRGGGGGGRIAVTVSGDAFSGVVRAFGGPSDVPARRGGPGTVYRRIAAIPGGVIFIQNTSLEGEAAIFNGVQAYPTDVLHILPGGKVSHDHGQFMDLSVLGVTVAEGGAIDVSFRGFPAASGPGASPSAPFNDAGGAAHGGNGGVGAQGPSGATYGSVLQPAALGSGGGSGGGTGGGAARITCVGNGRAIVNGQILSAGGPGSGGGGSGGSLWLSAGTLSGSGLISAPGGASGNGNRGGGGGGRVAVYFDLSNFAGLIRAFGGRSDVPARNGGPGTVFLKNTSDALGSIIIENASTDGEAAILNGEQSLPASLVIRPGGKLSHDTGQSMNLSLAGGLIVDAGGLINASGRGFGATQGPGGSPSASFNDAGGAAHGGNGGRGAQGPSGQTYGSVTQPTLPGSGGGSFGGSGGGVIRITAAGDGQIDGEIRSDGADGFGGGGSGGSVWLACRDLTGDGIIAADGGRSGNGNRGGGGGGRVAVYFRSSAFSGAFRAFAGLSDVPARNGGPGTVFLKDTDLPVGTIIIENSTLEGEAAILNGAQSFPAMLRIRSGGKLSHDDRSSLDLTLAGGLFVEAGGRIDIAGRGSPSATGPGASPSAPFNDAGGAGHAGNGGPGVQGPGGRTYGSAIQPDHPGSGGGSFGGAGGGVLRVTTSDPIRVDGVITASGADGFGGGGSGGSVWLNGSALLGAGLIAADGGGSGNGNRGGGGGGRIAVYTQVPSQFTGAIRTFGGSSATASRSGGPGTVFLKAASQPLGEIVIENNTLAGEAAILNGEQSFDASLRIKPNGKLAHDPAGSLALSLAGGLTIDAGGEFNLSGRGFAPTQGPGGAANAAFGDAGGGGYGGAGGPGTQASGGPAYGSADLPLQPGSGGGSSGGSGGGALLLVAQGPVAINGVLSANGGAGSGGGGSGGGLIIRAPSLSGSGIISASGAPGGNSNRGGGGGGRIAIYSCDLQLPLSNILLDGGGAGIRRGQDGTLRFGSGAVTITSQPVAGSQYLFGEPIDLECSATTTQIPPTLSFRWRRDGQPLFDGDLDGRVSGAGTPNLVILGSRCGDSGAYDCLISDACGGFPTNPVQVRVRSRADFNGDFELTPDDLSDFISAYFSTPPGAGTDFNGDGNVDPDDLSDFITLYFSGC